MRISDFVNSKFLLFPSHKSLKNLNSQIYAKSEIRNPKSEIPRGVWCNASIRVLGTRGDSSTLSIPTKNQEAGAAGRSRNSMLIQILLLHAAPASWTSLL
jgi:hypothetical protein